MSADPIGGVWTYALDLARGLQSYNVHVVLATLGAPLSIAQRCAARALSNVTLEEGDFRLEWMPEPWGDVRRGGDWLLQLARRHHVHLVHLNHLVHADLPFGVPVISVVHSCVLTWWESVHREPAPVYYDRYREEVRRSLQSATAVITLSHAMAQRIQRHYGPLPDVTVINNARPIRRAAPLVKAPRIFSAGRLWDAAKNVAGVVRVAPRIPWPVYIAGSEVQPGIAEGTPNEFDAIDRRTVRMLGQLPAAAMDREYRRTAIYALPARYEPFGLTALEAAHAACALVLGDIDTLRELWDGAAVFVSPDDERALAVAINALISDPQRRQVLANAAYERAHSFCFTQFVHEYLVAYRTCHASSTGVFDGIRRQSVL